MSWIWGALMPHPPIIIPEVGKGREVGAAVTVDGIKRLIQSLKGMNNKPERLLVLSPHQLYAPGALFVNTAEFVSGSFLPFGVPGTKVSTACVNSISLISYLNNEGIPTMSESMEDITKDHGSLVPLSFLSQCWDTLPPVIIANPVGLNLEQAYALGHALKKYNDGARWALLASGDLSHCLIPGAPAGYSPEGKKHDALVVKALSSGDVSSLLHMPGLLRKDAKECGLCSVVTLMGLCNGSVEVLSYEAPFGVGYCTALHMLSEAGHPYPKFARLVLEKSLRGILDDGLKEQNAVLGDVQMWEEPGACFVSIKTKDGSLRGCIGTILPTQPTLREEIIANAISASSRDPRFPPMSIEELDDVVLSVDVLSSPELVTSETELNPAIYGVIVTKNGRRGLLLPDLEGVDTIKKQLSIAAQKGGIADLDGAEIQRFTVNRYTEG